jgi:hypothetical protein
MERVTLDQNAINVLRDVDVGAEVCDQTGVVVGRFYPTNGGQEGSLLDLFDVQELMRRQQKGGGRTLAEIMADLEKRS